LAELWVVVLTFGLLCVLVLCFIIMKAATLFSGQDGEAMPVED
jgi:ABC-type cobalt transport system substrate-binding protein